MNTLKLNRFRSAKCACTAVLLLAAIALPCHAGPASAPTSTAPAASARQAVKLPPAAAAQMETAVQNLLKTIKRPPQAAVGNEQDFIDVGVLESPDILESGLEIGGILTDDSVTRFGHDLLDAFNRAWRPPEGANYNITFSERNDANRGSFISVRLNEMLVYEGVLTPRDEAINDLGKGLARDIRALLRTHANLEAEEFY